MFLSHYLFSHAVIIRHEVYMEHLHRAELDGHLFTCNSENEVLFMALSKKNCLNQMQTPRFSGDLEPRKVHA